MNPAASGPADKARPPLTGAGDTQQELLAWARGILPQGEGSNPAQEARILLEWAMGVESLWNAPTYVDSTVAERFREGVQRRYTHEPLQHIIERMWFRSLTLRARPGVFVCRPETESVAGVAIDEAQRLAREDNGNGKPVVVDLCSGSGAIALAVATEVPSARVVAVEFDQTAAELARLNISELAPERVELVVGDATNRSTLAAMEGTVNVVVANPPYIPQREPVRQEEALADPEAALYGGGEDGMVIVRGIIGTAWHLLAPGGLLVMEHASCQGRITRHEAHERGFVDVLTRPDLTGRDRMLCARRASAQASV